MDGSMNFNDWLQLALEACALLGFGLGAANRWATANHADRLAMFTGAAANAAGRIRLALSELPPGADPKATRDQLLSEAADQLMREFAKSAARIGATPAKAENIILGQLAAPALVASVAPP